MVIETERLWIRTWRDADAARVLDIHSRLEVVKWLGAKVPVPMKDLTEAHERIQRWNSREDPPCGYWAIEVKETGLVAGAVSLVALPNGGGEVEVAWHLHPDSHGHGYATEAAAAALRRGFEGGLAEILALTDLDNYPSQAVCRRLGMTDVGVVEKWYELPSQLFRMTAEEHAALGT
jgi:RimJ/RimL family protein N-acetyltransferase